MEYASNGELFNYILKKKRLSEIEACKIYQQIVNGIEYIHQNFIVHRYFPQTFKVLILNVE